MEDKQRARIKYALIAGAIAFVGTFLSAMGWVDGGAVTRFLGQFNPPPAVSAPSTVPTTVTTLR